MTKISGLPPADTRYVYPTPPIRDPISEKDHDNQCVIVFSAYMRQKLAEARDKGRGGWWDKDECTQGELSKMLIEHLFKGDPRDVANFCMFLHARGESIARDVVDGMADEAIADTRSASEHQQKVVDDSLDLVTLPPIRVSKALGNFLEQSAKANGLVIQAYVRQLLDAPRPPLDGFALDTIANGLAVRIATTLDERVKELQTRLDASETARVNLHKQLGDLTRVCVDAKSRVDNAAHSFAGFREEFTKSYRLLGWNDNGTRISEGSAYVGRKISELPHPDAVRAGTGL